MQYITETYDNFIFKFNSNTCTNYHKTNIIKVWMIAYQRQVPENIAFVHCVVFQVET